MFAGVYGGASAHGQRRPGAPFTNRVKANTHPVNESFTLRRHYTSEEIRGASGMRKARVLGFNFAQTAPVKWRIRRLFDAPLGTEGGRFSWVGCPLEGISHLVLRLRQFLWQADCHLARPRRSRRPHTPRQLR